MFFCIQALHNLSVSIQFNSIKRDRINTTIKQPINKRENRSFIEVIFPKNRNVNNSDGILLHSIFFVTFKEKRFVKRIKFNFQHCNFSNTILFCADLLGLA